MPGLLSALLLFTCRITQTSNLKSFKLFEELSLSNHSRCVCVCLCLTLIVSTCCCCCCFCYFCCSALWQSYLSDTLHSFAIGSRFLSYQATLKCLAQILDSWFLSSLHWECRRQTVYAVGTTQWKPSGAAFLASLCMGVCVCVVTKTRCVIIITDRQQSWPWVVKQQNSWTVQQFELCVMCCIELISWPGQVSATHTHTPPHTDTV